ncbi:MOP flippase family protein [Dyella sp. C11]|uniref:MOP flippase family protein n=1 Tax=Dyella sp. C11 TaxID=2126991 RepID=UPI000D642159|nr:MOP flippase family protein [Dyella sp. C11]
MKAPFSDLAGSARRGARFTTVASAVVIGFQVCQISVLARILAPSDFAIASIASVAVSLLAFYADFGLSGAIVHFKQASKAQLSTLYWINVIAGTVLAILLIALAPWVGLYFDSPKLTGTLQWLSPVIVFSSATGQYRAILQRDLSFGILAFANASNAAMSFVAAITAAMMGMGVFSVAIGAVAGSLIAAVILFFRSPGFAHPSRIFQLSGVSPFLRFGGYQVAERTLGFINTQIDVLVLGKFVGMAELGRYAPIKTLCIKPVMLVNPILTSVSFPIMSAANQDLTRVARIYLMQIRSIVTLTAPLYFFCVICAGPIVDIFLGPQWKDSTVLFQWLAMYGLLVSMGNPVGSLLLATGRARASFLWNLGLSVLFPLAAVVASPYGVSTIAATITILEGLLLIPGWRILVWASCGASFGSYLAALARPAAIAALAAGITWPITRLHFTSWETLLLTGFVGSLLYAALSLAFNRETATLLWQTIRQRHNTDASASDAHTVS